jgi:predicted nucleic acid-binding protein
VTLLYADTSAIIRAFLTDEREHVALRAMLLGGDDPVVVSEIARVEIARAVDSAARSGRIADGPSLLDAIDAVCGDGGSIRLLSLQSDVVLPLARRYVLEYGLRTLDAIHLAVASQDCPMLSIGSDFGFVTRDDIQAAAATALGFSVR